MSFRRPGGGGPVLPVSQPALDEKSLEDEQLLCPFRRGYEFDSLSNNPASDGASGDGGAMAESPTLVNPTASQIGLLPIKSRAHADIPDSVIETLPTFIHSQTPSKEILLVKDHFDQYLALEMYLKRLNDIHGMLWMCGRPLNARPLHKQLVDNRRIIRTEQADLHLLSHSDQVILKPLPSYILCKEVWDHHICKRKSLHKGACGLLLSYIWLIRSPLDFQIARKHDLLPSGLTWPEWKRIVDESLKYIDADSLDLVNKRYYFGELRLQRVNSIYRTHPGLIWAHFIRGYLYGYNRYSPFLQRNLAWVLGASVLFSLVLSAMQVGTGVPRFQKSQAFNTASFGFVIFSTVVVGVVLGFVLIICSFVFVYNMIAAIQHDKEAARQRAQMAPMAKARRARLIRVLDEKA